MPLISKGGEIETLIRSISMNVIMTKCCHQCQRGRLSDSWLRLMDSWYGLLVVIDVNHWRVILYIDFNPLSLMSTLEEILVANSGSTKVWVMGPSLFDVNMTHYFLVIVDKKYKWMNYKVVPLW